MPSRSRSTTTPTESPLGLALDVEQFDVEDQRRVRRKDAAGAARAVAEIGRNDQSAFAADLHGGDAFVPAGDDVVSADRKLEWLAAIDRAVEFLALGAVLIQPAGIMHDADLAGLRRSAGAGLGVGELQSRGCGHGFPGGLSESGGGSREADYCSERGDQNGGRGRLSHSLGS